MLYDVISGPSVGAKSPEKQAPHISIDQALERLHSAVSNLLDAVDLILEGPKPKEQEQGKVPSTQLPFLQIINGAPGRINTEISRINDAVQLLRQNFT